VLLSEAQSRHGRIIIRLGTTEMDTGTDHIPITHRLHAATSGMVTPGYQPASYDRRGCARTAASVCDGASMARTLGEVIANARVERRDKIAADYGLKLLAEEQKRIAVEKWLRLEKAKRVMELDRNLITIAAVITALPIIAALAWMLTVLAVGGR
jgi:hypothetical protein